MEQKAYSISAAEERKRRRAKGLPYSSVSRYPEKPPASGIFFNDSSDGDLRGRTEGLYGSGNRSDRKGRYAQFSVRKLREAVTALARRDLTVNSGAEGDGLPGMEELGGDFRGLGNELGTELYNPIVDNPFLSPLDHPLSTFSIDVDTASYANVRRFLQSGRLPPADAVRLEELVNYFHYDYEGPKDGAPFAVHMEVNECPWNSGNRLVRIGLKGKSMADEERPPANLVFLLDVSGSMHDSNKLPLLKKAMKLLVERLDARDRVAIVTYASQARVALESTPCDRKEMILQVIDGLSSGGSTHWSAGLEIAYRKAAENFLENGINRVILATDGDFNVGVTSQGGIVSLIEEKARGGVFLTALGFGMGNYKDANMEALADRGNGNAAYIDGFEEAKKVFIEGLAGTLHAIAKDVKIQVEFNPVRVSAYRLVGYTDRLLRDEDFNDDRKDAGEIGAGHVVTAFYEIVPAEAAAAVVKVDPLRYQDENRFTNAAYSWETLSLKIRYKEPRGAKSRLLCFTATDAGSVLSQASSDHRFACAVASFGMLLRDSPFKGNATFENVLRLAGKNRGMDIHGRRAEFVKLLRKAADLSRSTVGGR